ncbi:unnamed protein product [Candidula unifasciata]|uniref:Ig-like domain-containing protein n=1 Tax=Candidula unifasciata TaxID=100452 RepID=A0A8S3Z953_9EUPU|nr:unnamed protein product [Candidula unifasciata]
MAWTLAFCVMCLVLLHTDANEQSWSQQSYLDVEYRLSCNDSSINVTAKGDVAGIWTKLGYDGDLTTDDNYELTDRNMSLVIKRVTPEMAGIYFCEVIDQDGENVGRVVRGLNVVEHRYHDILDKYRTDIIRGVITAAAVVVLVVGVCLIDRFQYQTQEQKQASREMAENHKRRLRQSIVFGIANPALDEDSGTYRHYGSLKSEETATPF